VDYLKHRLTYFFGAALSLIGLVLLIGNLLLFFVLSNQTSPSPNPLVTGFALMMALVGGLVLVAGRSVITADRSIQEAAPTRINPAVPTTALWSPPIQTERRPAGRGRRLFFGALVVCFLGLWLFPVLIEISIGQAGLGTFLSLGTLLPALLGLFLLRLAYRSPAKGPSIALSLLALLIALFQLSEAILLIAVIQFHP
jgi:hypothetical protein